LRFEATGLKPFEGQGPYGTTLTVLDIVNKKVIGQAVLFPSSEVGDFGSAANGDTTGLIRIAADQLKPTASTIAPSPAESALTGRKTHLLFWTILLVAGGVCAVLFARYSLRNVKRTLGCMLIISVVMPAVAQRQLEKLGRGVVAVRTGTSSVYVGWRLLGTDPGDIGFNLYRSANGGAPVKLKRRL
jgi:hypothetical protein